MDSKNTIDFERIFHLAPIGMCISRNRIILACNEAMTDMFGLGENLLVDASFQILYPTPDEFERTGARIAPIMNAKGSYSDERIMKRASQELFWCHVSGRVLEKKNASTTEIWTFEDLSAKRPVSAELTPREREISAMLVEGKTSKLIARQIGLSPRTVEMHRAKLMRKFCASTSSELVHKLLGLMH
ncbi:LuxR C-terminal-related transcriptional regulator [Undibacterium sp. MH2W]|uniref:LuxR C-terminal-related transcriptional regulator n=1 Tax=Undibacterium sp. MH2W TaxID=3413044 RepID=UPI003BF3CDED